MITSLKVAQGSLSILSPGPLLDHVLSAPFLRNLKVPSFFFVFKSHVLLLRSCNALYAYTYNAA
jgi:hypothetical protein